MKYDPEKHDRRSIRLEGYDYRQPGMYFVTICVRDQACLFGEVVDGKMCLNAYGVIAREEWYRTEELSNNVQLDAFVVMPNHVHDLLGIVCSDDSRDMARHVPTRQFARPQADSLSSIVGAYKSAVTRRINRRRDVEGRSVWQSRFYDHIVLSKRALRRIRRYIG